MRRMSLVAVFTAQACWTTPPRAIAPPSAPAAASRREPDFSATIADPMGFLPGDAEVVLAVDIAQLRASSLWQTFEPKLLDKLGPKVVSARQECGFDPLAELQSVTVGGSHLDDKPSATVVLRGLDRGRVLACLKRAASPKVTFDGDRVLYHAADANDLALQFVDGKTAVAVIGETVGLDDLARVVGSGSPVWSGPLADVFDELDRGPSMWFVLSGAMKQLQLLSAVGARTSAVFATIDLGDHLIANAHLRLDSPAAASQLVASYSAQLGAAKMFFERFDIAAIDRDVVFDIAASEAQVTQLLSIAGVASP